MTSRFDTNSILIVVAIFTTLAGLVSLVLAWRAGWGRIPRSWRVLSGAIALNGALVLVEATAKGVRHEWITVVKSLLLLVMLGSVALFYRAVRQSNSKLPPTS